MLSDYHYRNLFDQVRRVVHLFTTPIQYAVDYPIKFIGFIEYFFESKRSLLVENKHLRHQQALLNIELQKLWNLRKENSQLRELLLTSATEKIPVMAAQVLAVDARAIRHFLVLNKGKKDGVYVGQAVLDSQGMMGKVIDIGSMTSTVLLISDAKSAVPVKNNRTGEQAILVGTNNMKSLSLINLPKTSLIKEGDLLVTSSLGNLYPEGYPVGRISRIKNISSNAFIKVDVAPIACLDKNNLVLLIWPDKEHAILDGEVSKRMALLSQLDAT